MKPYTDEVESDLPRAQAIELIETVTARNFKAFCEDGADVREDAGS